MSAQDAEHPPGTDILGAPWPDDPRLLEQQSLEAEPDPGAVDPRDHGGVESGRSAPDAPDQAHEAVRSAVKITKTTRGTTFEVRVLAGDPEALLTETRRIAVAQYQELERTLP